MFIRHTHVVELTPQWTTNTWYWKRNFEIELTSLGLLFVLLVYYDENLIYIIKDALNNNMELSEWLITYHLIVWPISQYSILANLQFTTSTGSFGASDWLLMSLHKMSRGQRSKLLVNHANRINTGDYMLIGLILHNS